MKTDSDMNIEEPVTGANAEGNDLHRGRSREGRRAGALALPQAGKRSYGPESAPAELLAFLAARSVSEAADVLGLSRKQVHRVRAGYWPADPRKIITAWETHKSRGACLASNWFLRRVQVGALVHHGRHSYTGLRLQEHVGSLVALARTADGGLLAQTLGGQPRLIVLQPVGGCA